MDKAGKFKGLGGLRVLVVTNMYPTDKKPQWGIFIYEQVESLRSLFKDELQIDVYLVNGDSNKLNYLKGLVTVPFVVRRGEYDLVHVHYGLTLFSVLLVRAPVVVTWHGSDLLVPPASFVSRLMKYKASRSIVVSQKLREVLGHGCVIPCGINVEQFLLPKKANLPFEAKEHNPRSLRVLFPSDPGNRLKNYPLFRKVCEHLEKRGFEIEEVFLRGIARPKVPSVFWSCDVMVLTSLSEGSPTVIKEAIAAKLPFVSVDVGDVKEWCNLVSFGVVEPSYDPAILAKRVCQLLEVVKDRTKLDNSAAVRRMDIRQTARKVKKVYDQVVNQAGATTRTSGTRLRNRLKVCG